MSNKQRVKDRLAMLTNTVSESSSEDSDPPIRHGERNATAFMPIRHAGAASEGLTARIAALDSELASEKAGRSTDRESHQKELERLRLIAASAGDAAGEFALLDSEIISDALPADRLPGAFQDVAFSELLRDIETHGQHDAITVRRTENGFEIASGRRRLEACRRLGIQVLARVRDLDEEAMLGVQFAENERRQDISAIERARWLAQVKDRLGKRTQQLADNFGLDRTTVSLYLRLARMPQPIVDRLADARALPMLKARRLISALERDPEALTRVTVALDRYAAAAEARGIEPIADDQVDIAIRTAEGRDLPAEVRESRSQEPSGKRVVFHRGRRAATLLRNGGQWVVRFAAATDDRLVWAIAERLPGLMEDIEAQAPEANQEPR
jgi:ParB family chromosome partitioning protein